MFSLLWTSLPKVFFFFMRFSLVYFFTFFFSGELCSVLLSPPSSSPVKGSEPLDGFTAAGSWLAVFQPVRSTPAAHQSWRTRVWVHNFKRSKQTACKPVCILYLPVGVFLHQRTAVHGHRDIFHAIILLLIGLWGHRKTVMITRPLSIRSLSHTTSHTQSSHHALVKIALRSQEQQTRAADQSLLEVYRRMRSDRSQSTVSQLMPPRDRQSSESWLKRF